ncbi:MAG: helix-turn-helix domain-containing protein [Methanosarcinales archaeon]|nr:helix-turn-helix domain-containing protein [Methanosarcinales archaeon]
MRPTCEIMVLKVLPAIRAELARIMMQDLKMSQQEIARRLGVSKAAISQYASAKRGADTDFSDDIKKELKVFADAVATSDDTSKLIGDFCDICKNIQNSGWNYRENHGTSEFIHEDCTPCMKAKTAK